MDVLYTLNKVGFNVDDDTEAMDVLYWYSAYQKDQQKAEEARKRANKMRIGRR